jgi:KAP family P-loop domain
MLQLRNRLKTVAPNSRTIEFNAWKYDKQEELWAAFALNLTRSLRHQTHWTRRFLGDLKLYFSRIKSVSEALKLTTFALAWLFILVGAGFIFFNFAFAGTNGRAVVVKQALEDLVNAKPSDKQDKPVPAGKPPAALSLTSAEQSNPTPAQMAGVHDIHYWLGQSTWAGAGVVILALLWKLPESFRKRLFSTQIEQYIDKPDYKGKAAFLDTFSQDFTRTVRAYSRTHDAKIFVFIDDLDRCEAPKAADLMQAINLLIGDGNLLIFILGLDRAKVAAAVAFKFREIIPYLDPSLDLVNHPANIRSFGDNFLEKFIQLSFRLPISSNEARAHRFIDSLISDTSPRAADDLSDLPIPRERDPEAAAAAAAESARRALRIESGAESQRIRDIVMMVREMLEYSPRRIKTFLNAFRLALYIASAQGLLDIDVKTGEAEVTPERLGKFLALTNRFPEIRGVLDRDPDFLEKLENIALAWRGETSDPLDIWLERPGIRKLMSYGIPERTLTRAWTQQYSMKNFPAWKFDTVLPAAISPPANRISEPADGQIPLSAEARARYLNLYSEAEAAVQNTGDATILGNLNDSKDAIGAVITADNQARLVQDEASFDALRKQLSAAEAQLQKVNLQVASRLNDAKNATQVEHPTTTETSSKIPTQKRSVIDKAATVKAIPIRRGNRGDSSEKTQKLSPVQEEDVFAEHELKGLRREGQSEEMPAE